MKKISNKLHHQEALTIIILGVTFAGLALKLEKVGPNSNFQSMSVLAIHCRTRQETVSLWNSTDAKNVLAF